MSFTRSVPLAVQLLIVLVTLVVATTVALTVTAYRSSVAALEAAARSSVRMAAETRDEMITSVVRSRKQSLDGVMASARSLCGEELSRGRIAWAIECVAPMIHEFRATQRAVGVRAVYGRRELVRSGERPLVGGPDAMAPSRLVTAPDGEHRYQIRVSDAGLTITAEFPFNDSASPFGIRDVIGNGGEVLLLDRTPQFLTPTPEAATAIANEPVADCFNGPGEIVGPDYRGRRVIHAFRRIEALDLCVDAHLPIDEALAPAEQLRSALVRRSWLFILFGALLSLVAAQWVAAPVRRLAGAAARVERGDFKLNIVPTGPPEVRSLSTAFQTMADHLADLVAREKAARRDAENANEAKDKFLAVVSHELRTQLTAVLGWIRLARVHRLREADVERALAAIERGAGTQQRLVDDLLDVSRIARGQMHLQMTVLPLTIAVQAAIDALRPKTDERRVRVDAALDGSVLVHGDAERLQQIAANLLSNAVKFTPPGGVVTVQVRGAADLAELIVSDTGPGIPPDLLPHVFEWFRQGDAEHTQRHSGLGLGLGIVRQLVDLHSGHVKAESRPGRGATFTVTLPLVDSQAAVASLERAHTSSVLPHVSSSGPGDLDVFGGVI